MLNAGAGSIQGRKAAEFADLVRTGLEARGLDAEVRLASGDAIVSGVRAFLNKARAYVEAATVVVGGGDGTVSAVAAQLADTDGVLGVLPLGTLNHFAKDLGIPVDLGAAMDVIKAGNVRKVDAADVNGRVFVNNSSIGIYPFLVTERTAEQHRRGVGKLAAIGPALMRTVRGSSWQTVKITAQGETREVRTPCVFVGNNFYDLANLGRRSGMASGELCVYVVKDASWLGLAILPFRIVCGLARSDRDVELHRVKSLTIRAGRSKMLVATDGETFSEPAPLSYRIRPGALRVLAPEPAL